MAMYALAVYAFSGDPLLGAFGTFAGFPWSIPLWFVEGQTLSPVVQQALVVGCALLNVVLLAALLRFAWVKTNRGAYTDALDGTGKVCALAGGSLLLVGLASLGIVYTKSLAPALVGSAVALMMASAMFYLLPWQRVVDSLLFVGVCVAGLWGVFAVLLVLAYG